MQRNVRLAYIRPIAAGLASLTLAMLAGCGVSQSSPSTDYSSPVKLQGQVFAGRNYMAGATVKIYATQSSGVAGANGGYTGAAKLLTTVTANTTGTWSVQGLTCSSPDQLYVTAEAGIPYPSASLSTTLANNPNSLMMTAIGDCSILSSAAVSTNITSIVTNEASTVAAVWALRNFISLSGTTVNVTAPATNYAGSKGVGIPGSFAGLAHAFLNANNLSPYKVGNFPQYTNGSKDGTGGGLVPVQELNSLAYAQYLCTIGGTQSGDFSYCNKLFQLATPPGGSAPTNSLQAMLNIARYPANNAQAILDFTLTPIPYTTQTGSQQINAGVYVPALTSFGTGGGSATDWSVAIYYLAGYGATSTGQGSTYPSYVTVDANDDVYFSNPNASTSTAGNVIALASNGTTLWTTDTDTKNLVSPRAIAADASGHIWIANGSTTSAGAFVQEMDAATGNTIQRYPSTSTTLYGVAVDSLGNIWYGSNTTTGQNLHELARNGSTYAEATFATPPSSTLSSLLQIRPDSSNNIWVAGNSTSRAQALYFPNTGTAAVPTYTAGLKSATPSGSGAYGIAPDASGNAYLVSNGTGSGIYKTTVTGAGSSAVLNASSMAANPAAASRFLDIDGTGSIWYLDNATGAYLYQFAPSSGTTTSYYSCYNAGTTTGTGSATSTVQVCSTGMSLKLDLAIDSTGSIWVASYGNSGGGRMVQIIGLAAPTVPLKALGKPGVMP
jgi:hypothetical protein